VNCVYFDHAAATPVLPEVFEAMRPFFQDQFGNPASFHQLGLMARDAVDQARREVASLICAASSEEIIFTSGGTEALNLAVKGVAYAGQRRGNHLVASAIEQPAILQSLGFLEKNGFSVTRVGVDREGRIAPDDIKNAMTDQTLLICVHMANHEIGTVQTIREMSMLADERGVPMLVDATTGGGWMPIDVRDLGVCMLVLAPHRFNGPKGVGVLYRHRRVSLNGIIHGGPQEDGRRAGTENVPAIVGAGKAAVLALRDLPERQRHVARLQHRLWEGLKSCIPSIQLNGPAPGSDRLATNLNFSVRGAEGEAQVLRCDLNGIALASGSSCLSRSVQVSPVLAAIGLEHDLARCSVLLTLGHDNTDPDVELFLSKYPQVVSHLRRLSPELRNAGIQPREATGS
jgi:cysteine desulfurase